MTPKFLINLNSLLHRTIESERVDYKTSLQLEQIDSIQKGKPLEVLQGAIESCTVSDYATSDHFPSVTKMIDQDYNRSVAL